MTARKAKTSRKRGRKRPDLKVELVPIGDVVPYDRNPRHNDQAVGKVAASIEAYGWRQPIVVDKALTVVAGHTRLEAAYRLGLQEVPVHIASNLTAAQVKAYRLADNRTGQEATWDQELLGLELADLKAGGSDLDALGFDGDELDRLLGELGETTTSGAGEGEGTRDRCGECGQVLPEGDR